MEAPWLQCIHASGPPIAVWPDGGTRDGEPGRAQDPRDPGDTRRTQGNSGSPGKLRKTQEYQEAPEDPKGAHASLRSPGEPRRAQEGTQDTPGEPRGAQASPESSGEPRSPKKSRRAGALWSLLGASGFHRISAGPRWADCCGPWNDCWVYLSDLAGFGTQRLLKQ